MPVRFEFLFPLAALLLSACSGFLHQPATTSQANASQDVAVSDRNATFRTEEQPTLLAAAEPMVGILVSAYTAPETSDLWEQLRREFQLPEQDNKRIRIQRNWYVKHPAYMQRVTERAKRYGWHIQQQLKQRNMPAEIALLPIVESAYDPFAYSHGRAAGLWQFVPATGKHFGLKQDWWYDGRRDILDSTTAALDYLQHLNKRFKGDWLLALAAYNSGEGTVAKAQRKNRRKGKPVGFWDLELPRETQDYVPKLIALKQLVGAPSAYGIQLEAVPNRPFFEVVDTGAQIDLAVAADLAGIELDALYRLNPGFNQWATAPAGPHRLLIPVDQAGAFRQAMLQLAPEKRIQWIRHKVKKGQTLSHISRHYHTTVEALKTANSLKNSSIRVGKYLMVPVSTQGQDNYRLSARQRLKRKQNSTRKGYKTQHRVSNGDTFWGLSKQYKVSVRKLASWNGMAPGDPLRVGQKLVVWVNQPSSGSLHPGSQARAIHYTVKKGDSLARISSRFKVTVTDLRKWNALRKDRYLQPGQRLKLYVDVTRQTGT
ncbi:MAG: LysM peptidoglycan-binding domain-containing protein [Thiogranum sp.]